MSEVVPFEPLARRRGAGESGTAPSTPSQPQVFFDRREFEQVLNLYGRMVAAGEWRDYAISHDTEKCEFAVFKRSSDGPLFRIVKIPKLARRQGAYMVLSSGGRILKRGHDFRTLLRYFDPPDLQLV
jgi:hypothetical protein